MRFAFILVAFFTTAAVAQEADVHFVDLRPLWEVGADDDGEVLFGVISSVDVDAEGNVYVLDRQLTEVSRFSHDGQYLGPVGREGEGPGEYSRIGAVFADRAGEIGVVQRMPGRIVSVRVDGAPGGEIALPAAFTDAPAYFFGAGRVGEDLVLAARQLRREKEAVSMTTLLVRVSPAGEELARMSEFSEVRDMGQFTVDEKTNAPVLWAAGPDGSVYVNDEFDAYSVRVYAPSGELVRTLHREYRHRQRSEAEIELNTPRMEIRRRGGQGRSATGVPSRTDRDVQALFARPDGTLWVLGSHGAFDQPEGILATFDVFSASGEFLHQVCVRGEGDFADDGLHLVGERLFVLRGLRAAERAARGAGDEEEDAEAEPMSVACYELATRVPALAEGD